MCSTDDRVLDAARRLHEARLACRPIAPLAIGWPELDEPTAYAIAHATASLRGDAIVGYKLGYTSAAMRAQMKVDTPNYGSLFAGTQIGPDGVVRSGELIHPLVEPEIAFVLSDGGLAAMALPALEIVDTRYERYEFTAVDNIADTSSAARYVIGTPLPLTVVSDLRTVAVELRRNDEAVAHGTGADVMGDPLAALAWFVARRERDGRPVRGGDIVLSGGITAAQPARAGDVFRADFGRLGVAECRFV